MFEHPTIEALVSLLDRELPADGASVSPPPPPAEHIDASPTAPLASIEQLSDQEVEALIAEELARVAHGNRRD
jgi:polyketide synthase 12/myxalamid-type polyketide synthase MxaB